MKKVLWLIVLILLLATFSDHPLLKPYKEQLYGLFSSEAAKASQIQGDQVVRTIAKKLQTYGGDLGQGQQAELKRLAESKQNMAEFYRTYCLDKQFNPLFFGADQQRLCEAMAQYEQALLH